MTTFTFRGKLFYDLFCTIPKGWVVVGVFDYNTNTSHMGLGLGLSFEIDKNNNVICVQKNSFELVKLQSI